MAKKLLVQEWIKLSEAEQLKYAIRELSQGKSIIRTSRLLKPLEDIFKLYPTTEQIVSVVKTMTDFTSYKDNYADMIMRRNDATELTAETLVEEYIKDFYYDRPGYSISPGTIGFIQLDGEQSQPLPNLAGSIFEPIRAWLFYDEYHKQEGDSKNVTEINKKISDMPLYGGFLAIVKVFKKHNIEFNGMGYVKLDGNRVPMLSQNQFIFLNGIAIITSIAPLFFLKGYGDDKKNVDEFTAIYKNVSNIMGALISTKWVNYLDKEEIEKFLQTTTTLLKEYCTVTIEDPELWDADKEITWNAIKDDAKLINALKVVGIDKISGIKETISAVITKTMLDNAIGTIGYFPEAVRQNIFTIQPQYLGPLSETIDGVMKDLKLVQVIDGFIASEDMGRYQAYATEEKKETAVTDALLSRNAYDKNHPITVTSSRSIANNVRTMSSMSVTKSLIDKVYVENDVYYGVSGIEPIPTGLTNAELILELKASIRRLI